MDLEESYISVKKFVFYYGYSETKTLSYLELDERSSMNVHKLKSINLLEYLKTLSRYWRLVSYENDGIFEINIEISDGRNNKKVIEQSIFDDERKKFGEYRVQFNIGLCRFKFHSENGGLRD